MPYVQIGIIAARDEDGNFLPSQPLYIQKSEREVMPSGLTKKQDADCDDFAKYMAARFKKYQEGVRKERRRLENGRKHRETALQSISERSESG